MNLFSSLLILELHRNLANVLQFERAEFYLFIDVSVEKILNILIYFSKNLPK